MVTIRNWITFSPGFVLSQLMMQFLQLMSTLVSFDVAVDFAVYAISVHFNSSLPRGFTWYIIVFVVSQIPSFLFLKVMLVTVGHRWSKRSRNQFTLFAQRISFLLFLTLFHVFIVLVRLCKKDCQERLWGVMREKRSFLGKTKLLGEALTVRVKSSKFVCSDRSSLRHHALLLAPTGAL